MKKLLSNKVVLTHITGYAGPAAYLPMKFAFNIEIPEFGYSYVEEIFYPPYTNGDVLGDYSDTWIRYPVNPTEDYLMKRKNDRSIVHVVGDDVKIGTGEEAKILKYLYISASNAPLGIINGLGRDMASSYLFPDHYILSSRIIDSFTINGTIDNTDEDPMENATHYVCIKIVSVRNIVDLFRREICSERRLDDEEEDEEEDDGMGRCEDEDGSCGSCWYCRDEEDRMKKYNNRCGYYTNIVNSRMRGSIIMNMKQHDSTRMTSDRDLDRSFRLRHWYWKISGCDELDFGFGYEFEVGYRDNFGILTIDELMWKMGKYEDLKSFLHFRNLGRECGKSEDNILPEFLEVDDGYEGYISLWWLLYSGAILIDEREGTYLHEVEEALKYEMYDEARLILQHVDPKEIEGEEESYNDLRERLGLNL